MLLESFMSYGSRKYTKEKISSFLVGLVLAGIALYFKFDDNWGSVLFQYLIAISIFDFIAVIFFIPFRISSYKTLYSIRNDDSKLKSEEGFTSIIFTLSALTSTIFAHIVSYQEIHSVSLIVLILIILGVAIFGRTDFSERENQEKFMKLKEGFMEIVRNKENSSTPEVSSILQDIEQIKINLPDYFNTKPLDELREILLKTKDETIVSNQVHKLLPTINDLINQRENRLINESEFNEYYIRAINLIEKHNESTFTSDSIKRNEELNDYLSHLEDEAKNL